MLLTSYDRMTRYLSPNDNDNLIQNSFRKRDILSFINSTSLRVEQHVNNKIVLGDYTEYKPIVKNQIEFRINHTPINSITSVKYDATGLFGGDEQTLDSDQYYICPESRTIALTIKSNFNSPRGLQISYNGGMAYHATQSVFNVDSVADWSVGNYCIGNDTSTVGIVKSIDSTNNRLTIEVLYGVFSSTETITEYTDEAGTTATGYSAIISSKYRTALCESDYSGIVTACEMEIRYNYKHKLDFENSSTDREEVTMRSDFFNRALRPETINMLNPYRRY